jgi:hypothetical protein
VDDVIDPQPPSGNDERRSHRRLLVIAALVVLAAVATVVVLAARQHRADAERAATACSDLDRALFEGLSVNRPPAAPVGEDDGACTLTVTVPGDAATALSALDSSMSGDGWAPSGQGAGPRLYTRGPDLMTAVPSTSAGGSTRLVLSLAP